MRETKPSEGPVFFRRSITLPKALYPSEGPVPFRRSCTLPKALFPSEGEMRTTTIGFRSIAHIPHIPQHPSPGSGRGARDTGLGMRGSGIGSTRPTFARPSPCPLPGERVIRDGPNCDFGWSAGVVFHYGRVCAIHLLLVLFAQQVSGFAVNDALYLVSIAIIGVFGLFQYEILPWKSRRN